MPAIRHQYDPVSYHGRRGIGNLRGAVPLPDEPTTALPGTPEKLAVFELRAAANRQLHHPADATDVEEPSRPTREVQPCRAA
jgi:hypothetical protein